MKAAIPAGICAILLLPSLCWIALDKTVWPWDQAWYGEVSVDLWYQLMHHPSQWAAALVKAFGFKAPGIAWLGEFFVPLGQAFGSIEFGLLFSVLAAQFATLLLIYGIGRKLSAGRMQLALFGVLFVSAGPLFVAMAHHYLVESLQLLAVTYVFRIAIAAPEWSRLRLIAHLLLAVACALLAKSSSPLYTIFPGLVAAFWVIRAKCWVKDDSDRRTSLVILAIGLFAAAAAAAWYALNLSAAAEFVKNASGGAASIYYGHVGAFGPKLMFWLHALKASFFAPWVSIALGLLILTVAALVWKVGVARKLRPAHFVVAAAVAEIILVTVVFACQVSEENRYLLPLAPALAICLMWVFAARNSVALIAAGVMAAQLAVVHGQALGFTGMNPEVSYWLTPYQPDLGVPGELRELIRLTSGPGTEFRYNITGVEYPWFNANSLSFYAAKGRLSTGRRNYFTSLGYAETDAGRAWNRMQQIRTLYFAAVESDRQPPPDFLNQVSVPVLNRAAADPAFVRVPFPSRLGIVIFRRVEATAR
ncbi:MAG: hypothetical protein M3O35_21120 [Acidobacteriota bacterium]|nr:hypothetical protein [Acidobacteriota bacterium]